MKNQKEIKEIVYRIISIISSSKVDKKSEVEKKKFMHINTEFNRGLNNIIKNIGKIKEVKNIPSIISNDLPKLQKNINNKFLDKINEKMREETDENKKKELLELSKDLSEMINQQYNKTT